MPVELVAPSAWLAMGLFATVALTAPPARAAIRGDVNLDERVDAADALVLQGYLRGDVLLDAEAFAAADLAPYGAMGIEPNGAVNVADLVVLHRALARELTLPIAPDAPTLDVPVLGPGDNPIDLSGGIADAETFLVYVNGELSPDAQCTLSAPTYACDGVVLLDGDNTIRIVAAIGNATSAASNEITVNYQNDIDRSSLTPPGPGETVVWTQGAPPGNTGPYLLPSGFAVPPDATLIVTRGSEIQLGEGAALSVAGTLKVRGKDVGPGCVSVVPDAGAPNPGREFWNGITIEAGGTAEIEGACIRNAAAAVVVSGQATIRASSIEDFHDVGVAVLPGGDATIQANQIDNYAGNPINPEGIGVRVRSADAGARAGASVKDNVILGTTRGVFLDQVSTAVLRNVIQRCTIGVFIRGWQRSPRLEENDISHNVTGIATQQLSNLTQFSNPRIWDNAITNNGLALESSEQSLQIDHVLDAERNWWGTEDPTAIAAVIEDRIDNQPTWAAVDFAPFRLESRSGPVDSAYQMGIADSDSTVLDAGQSYTILGRLWVPSGETWVVPEGVSFSMSGEREDAGPITPVFGLSSIQVEGTLQVLGSETGPVQFASVSPTPEPGDWQGISITGTGVNVIEYATFRHAERAVDVDGSSGAQLAIRFSEFRDFEEAGIAMSSVSGGEIRGNLIDNDRGEGYGFGIGVDLVNSSPSVTANTITRTATGLHVFGPAHPATIGGADPSTDGNVITQNATGIWLDGSGGADPDPVITGNDLFGNGTHPFRIPNVNLRISGFSQPSPPALDARENYWGTTDLVTIRGLIQEDLSNPVEIDVSGLLDVDRQSTDATALFNALLHSVSVSGDRFSPTLPESVSIGFSAPGGVPVTMRIYRETETVFSGTHVFSDAMTATGGNDVFVWDGTDGANVVPDEAYIYVLEADDGNVEDVYHPARDPERAGDGCCEGGDAPFNAYQNEFWGYNYRLVKDATAAPPLEDADHPSRLGLTVRVPTGDPQVAGALLATPFADRIFLPGFTFVVWDGRDDSGNVLSGDVEFWFSGPQALKPNYVLVENTIPTITGPGQTVAGLDIKADPYLIRQSYDQTATVVFEVSRDATVTVRILDAAGAALVDTPVDAQTVWAGQPFEFAWPQKPDSQLSSVEGPHTFIIDAVSVADPALTSRHRGVIQLRK